MCTVFLHFCIMPVTYVINSYMKKHNTLNKINKVYMMCTYGLIPCLVGPCYKPSQTTKLAKTRWSSSYGGYIILLYKNFLFHKKFPAFSSLFSAFFYPPDRATLLFLLTQFFSPIYLSTSMVYNSS